MIVPFTTIVSPMRSSVIASTSPSTLFKEQPPSYFIVPLHIRTFTNPCLQQLSHIITEYCYIQRRYPNNEGNYNSNSTKEGDKRLKQQPYLLTTTFINRETPSSAYYFHLFTLSADRNIIEIPQI